MIDITLEVTVDKAANGGEEVLQRINKHIVNILGIAHENDCVKQISIIASSSGATITLKGYDC